MGEKLKPENTVAHQEDNDLSPLAKKQVEQVALGISLGVNLWPGLKRPRPTEVNKLFRRRKINH